MIILILGFRARILWSRSYLERASRLSSRWQVDCPRFASAKFHRSKNIKCGAICPMSNKSIIPVHFFERPAVQVARDLIGAKLIRRMGTQHNSLTITET